MKQKHSSTAWLRWVGPIFMMGITPAVWASTGSKSPKGQKPSPLRVQTRQQSRLLEVGKPIESTIEGDETQVYRVELAAGQFLHVVVDQRGIDVVVALFDPNGKQLLALDSSSEMTGPEPIMAIAGEKGVYRVGVQPSDTDAPAGKYQIEIAEFRVATAKDRSLIAAERAFLAAESLRLQGTPESLRQSISKYQESLSEYRAAGDQIDEGVALNNLGSVCEDLGDLPRALDWYEQAVNLAHAIGDLDGEAVTLNNIGKIYDDRGDAQQALKYYLKALPIRRQLKDLAGEGTSANNIGAAYDSLGEKKQALEWYGQALELARAGQDIGSEAVALNNIGKVYDDLGQKQKALENYLCALTLYPKASDPNAENATLVNIGAVYDSWGNKRRALEYYLKALPYFQSAPGRSGEASVFNNIGSVYSDLSQWQLSLDYYASALTLYRAAGNQAGEATVLSNMGKVYDDQGLREKALDSLMQALTLHRALHDPFGEAAALTDLGAVYAVQGENQKAQKYYLEALELCRAVGNRAGEATALHNLGTWYESQGKSSPALVAYEHALQIRRALGDRAGEATTLNNLGTFYDARSEKQRALEFYLTALPLFQAVEDRAGAATEYNNIGSIYVSLGDVQKALDNYLRAESIFHSIEDTSGEAMSFNNLGRIHHDLDQKELAREEFTQALKLRRSTGDRDGEATVLNNLGGVYDSLDDQPKAIDYYTQARSIFLSLGDRRGEAVTCNNLGASYWESGDRQKALDWYLQALTLRRLVNDQLGEAVTLSNIGVVYDGLGDKQRALDWYLPSISTFESIRGTATIEEFRSGLTISSAATYTRAILSLVRLGRIGQAFALTERARARDFLDQLGNIRPQAHHSASAELIAEEQRIESKLNFQETRLRLERGKPVFQQNSDDLSSWAREIDSDRRRLEELLTQIKYTDPEYRALRSVDTLDSTEIQKNLDKNTTLLSYFVTPEKTLVFIIKGNSVQVVDIPVKEADLAAEIFSFRAFDELGDTEVGSLKHLYDWLVAPLKKYVKTRVIGIIPHGILNYLPFAALKNGDAFFGEKHQLFYLPSASVWKFIRAKDKRIGAPVLAVAQSKVDALYVLNNADHEVQTVAGLYHTTAFPTGSMSKAEFLRRAGDYNIIHLAVHAELNLANPLFTRIILAPDQGSNGGNNALEVRDIYAVDLSKAGLVVLSGCETQIGPFSKGDDIVGLNRAFIYAGTPAVIASLWAVEDESTSYLMKLFYTYLQSGKGKAAALQAAQLAARKKYPHPYYWSGFVLTGSP